MFEETSSREGLIENVAYAELRDFVYRSIISACQVVASIREKNKQQIRKIGRSHPQKNRRSNKWTTPNVFWKYLIKNKEADDKQDESNEQKEYFKRIVQQLSEGYNEGKEEKDRLIDEINMLRIFAALGLVIGEFIHEIKNYLPGFKAEVEYLQNYYKAIVKLLIE